MTSKTLLASVMAALIISISGMGLAHTEKVTDSLAIPNEERDPKLAAGYKLYPGVGWVSPEDIREIEPIYRVNPQTGDRVLDLDAMLEKADGRQVGALPNSKR